MLNGDVSRKSALFKGGPLILPILERF